MESTNAQLLLVLVSHLEPLGILHRESSMRLLWAVLHAPIVPYSSILFAISTSREETLGQRIRIIEYGHRKLLTQYGNILFGNHVAVPKRDQYPKALAALE